MQNNFDLVFILSTISLSISLYLQGIFTPPPCVQLQEQKATNTASNQLFKVKNINIITKSGICLKLTVKGPERLQRCFCC